MKPVTTIFGAATIILMCISTADASKKVALIIGNDTYENLPSLNNAVADARSMARQLTRMGWKTILETDANKRTISRSMDRFRKAATKANASLVYYAGHGIEVEGTNYLITSDSRIEEEADLRYGAIKSDDFLNLMKNTGTPVNILILDSCRNNPLEKKSRGSKRGLSIQRLPDGIGGTAIIYAAAPGRAAEDGTKGGNGIFTGALLESLRADDTSLAAVFSNTVNIVAKKTRNRQRPWKSSSLDERNFVFGNRFKEQTPLATVKKLMDSGQITQAAINALMDREVTRPNIDLVKLNSPILSAIDFVDEYKSSKKWYAYQKFVDRNSKELNTIGFKYFLYYDPVILKQLSINKKHTLDRLRSRLTEIGLDPSKLREKWALESSETEKLGPISQAFHNQKILDLWGEIPGIELRKEPIPVYKYPALPSLLKSAKPNDAGILTIDISISEKIDQILKKYRKRFKAKKVFSTLINSSNFEIIAINSVSDQAEKAAKNLHTPAIDDLYEWGSVVKPITYSVGLENRVVSPQTVFPTYEPLKINGFVIRDFGNTTNQYPTVVSALRGSSNTISAKIGLRLGIMKFESGFRSFGLLDKLKFFPAATSLSPDKMKTINVATMSFGHGVAFSQLHLSAAYAAMLNGGIIGDLTIFQNHNGCDRLQSKCQTGPKRIISQKVSKILRALLFDNVQKGTGQKAKVPGLVIMGKTGTAQLLTGGGNYKRELLSSFAGGFSVGRKSYVLVVSLAGAVGDKQTFGYATGGWTAAPAFGEIAAMLNSG